MMHMQSACMARQAEPAWPVDTPHARMAMPQPPPASKAAHTERKMLVFNDSGATCPPALPIAALSLRRAPAGHGQAMYRARRAAGAAP